jgi:acyl-CoA synthetase (NDP forming)
MHPLHGNWIADVAKSARHANHQFQNATMRLDVDADVVVLSYQGVNASGKQESSTQTIRADGQEHSVPGAPGIVVISTLEARRLESSAKRDGVALGRGTYEVSEDGRTLTATVAGIDASGKPFDQVIVFDRGQ